MRGIISVDDRMTYYTDKVFGSNFLSRSKGLEDMLVQGEGEEERPQLPQSRHVLLEERMKAATSVPSTRSTRLLAEVGLEPRQDYSNRIGYDSKYDTESRSRLDMATHSIHTNPKQTTCDSEPHNSSWRLGSESRQRHDSSQTRSSSRLNTRQSSVPATSSTGRRSRDLLSSMDASTSSSRLLVRSGREAHCAVEIFSSGHRAASPKAR